MRLGFWWEFVFYDFIIDYIAMKRIYFWSIDTLSTCWCRYVSMEICSRDEDCLSSAFSAFFMLSALNIIIHLSIISSNLFILPSTPKLQECLLQSTEFWIMEKLVILFWKWWVVCGNFHILNFINAFTKTKKCFNEQIGILHPPRSKIIKKSKNYFQQYLEIERF